MTTTMTMQCPNCGTPNQATVENLIDLTRNPALKNALLSGRLNTIKCANCGVPSAVAAPLLYHDPGKELLISFVPMELNLPKEQQDRVVGDLLKQLTDSIPKESFKGYMFQPKQALTMQGLVEQILEADGVTQEMMNAQRNTVKLVEELLHAGPDKLDDLIQMHDAEINAQFFQAAMAMMQRSAEDGQQNVVNALAAIQERAAQLSTYGQELTKQAAQREAVVREVADRLRAFDEQPQTSDIVDLTIDFANDDEYLQAIVGLIRPALDYQFFQTLSQRIDQTQEAERSKLESLRNRLLELTQMADQQAQLAMQNAAQVLQAIASSTDMDATIAEYSDLIDDTFMAVLAANIQESEKRADIQASSRLKQIYEKIVAYLQQNMQPELQLMNDLLTAESEEQAMALLADGIDQFGEDVLDIMDSVGQMLGQQGQTELAQKLAFLREAAVRQLH